MAARTRDRDDDRDDDRRRGRDDDRGSRRDGGDDRGGRGRSGGRGRDDDDEEDRGSRRKGADYEYAGRTSEENTQRAKQGSARYDSFLNTEVVWFSPKVGENQIRIIPWLNKKFDNFVDLKAKYGSHWGIDAVIHRNVGADNGTYLCLDKTLGEPCPICDAWRDDDEEKLKPSDRILCWVIDRKEEKAGPKLWNMPLGTSKDIQAASQDRQSGEWYNIEHPDEGYDIYFDREGEKARTRYKQFELAKKPSPLHTNEDKMDDWLGYVMEKPLPEYLKTYDVEKLEKVLSGQRSSRDDDDDDDRPRRGRGRDDDDRDSGRSARGRGRGDEEEDRGSRRSRDDDDRGSSRRRSRDEEEEEAETTRPSRRSRDDDPPEEDSGRSRARREDKDDDGGGRSRRRSEPEEEPEKEEEDPPRRRRAAADKGDKGGKVERHRPKDKDEEPEEEDDNGDDRDDDKEAAKENLRRVGRRGK